MQEITRSSPMTLVDSFTASRIARTWAIRLQSPDDDIETLEQAYSLYSKYIANESSGFECFWNVL